MEPCPGPEGGEPRANLAVRSSKLASTQITPEEVAVAIDELPILAVAATQAEGESRFQGVGELRVNLPVVAGLLTIIGYSLNDTIVLFDRIRENLRKRRKEELEHGGHRGEQFKILF